MLAQSFRVLFVALVISLLASLVQAQPSVPQSYTLKVSTAMALEAMSTGSSVEVKVSRFGPLEFVDVTAAAERGQGLSRAALVRSRRPQGLLARCGQEQLLLDDLHRAGYAHHVRPGCYAAAVSEVIAQFNKNTVRQENVNGIAAKLTESSSDQGKESIWVAVNGYYPVKAVMAFPGGQPILMLEVKELRFEKPSVALLAPPANCTTQAQGEWSATGMSSHFEFHVEGQVSGSVDLKTGKAKGGATVNSNNQPH